MLDAIAGAYYSEWTYVEISDKLEKISRNNKVWSTRKSDNGRNTLSVQATHNPSIYEIPEVMDQMRTELGLALKHVAGGAENVNGVNYLTKPQPPVDDYYYEENTYEVNH